MAAGWEGHSVNPITVHMAVFAHFLHAQQTKGHFTWYMYMRLVAHAACQSLKSVYMGLSSYKHLLATICHRVLKHVLK